MEKQDLLYEGKSKKVYATNDPARLIVAYKDEKGAVNNHISNAVMRMLEREGVPTHLVRQLSERETVVRRVRMIPLEIIVRNVVAGKLSTLIGQPEGTRLRSPVLEYRYKAALLGNPMPVSCICAGAVHTGNAGRNRPAGVSHQQNLKAAAASGGNSPDRLQAGIWLSAGRLDCAGG